MTRVGIAGDWHGNDRWAISALEWFYSNGVTQVVQVGDFGIWPGAGGEAYLQNIIATCENLGIKLWVVPGNHEDYTQIEDPEDSTGVVPPKQVLAEGEGWEVSLMPRGYQWDIDGKTFLAFGGAPSVDYDHRKQDADWWAEEAIRETDLLRLSEHDAVDVMLCHDAPTGSTAAVQSIIEIPAEKSFFSEKGLKYAAEGRVLMDKAVEIVKPNWFFHGHYHVADHRYDSVRDTHYVAMDLDGSNNNVGILTWNDEELGSNPEMQFRFLGGDSWI